MCGRTACALAPDDICKATRYINKNGRKEKPAWKDAPGGKKYYPSHNIAPASHTPVMLSSRHYRPAEIEEGVERVIQPMKWGLVPSWHKGDPYKIEYETNNCRAEGMMTKRTYKVPLEKGQRCVILAEGFFEWKRSEKNKQPYFIYFPKDKSSEDRDFKNIKPEIKQEVDPEKPKVEDIQTTVKQELVKVENIKQEFDADKVKVDMIKTEGETKQEVDVENNIKEEREDGSKVKVESDSSSVSIKTKMVNDDSTESRTDVSSDEDEWKGNKLLTMAGVFEIWKPPDGSDEIYSYSIITVDSSPAMAWIHHRMPAMLSTDEEIDQWLDFGHVPLSKACKLIRPTECITMHPVSSIVNNSRNKSPDCVQQIDPQKPKKSASSNFMMSWLGKKTENNCNEEPSSKRQKIN